MNPIVQANGIHKPRKTSNRFHSKKITTMDVPPTHMYNSLPPNTSHPVLTQPPILQHHTYSDVHDQPHVMDHNVHPYYYNPPQHVSPPSYSNPSYYPQEHPSFQYQHAPFPFSTQNPPLYQTPPPQTTVHTHSSTNMNTHSSTLEVPKEPTPLSNNDGSPTRNYAQASSFRRRGRIQRIPYESMKKQTFEFFHNSSKKNEPHRTNEFEFFVENQGKPLKKKKPRSSASPELQAPGGGGSSTASSYSDERTSPNRLAEPLVVSSQPLAEPQFLRKVVQYPTVVNQDVPAFSHQMVGMVPTYPMTMVPPPQQRTILTQPQRQQPQYTREEPIQMDNHHSIAVSINNDDDGYLNTFLDIVKKSDPAIATLILNTPDLLNALWTAPQGSVSWFLWYGRFGGPLSKDNGPPIDALDLCCYCHDYGLSRKGLQDLTKLVLNHFGEDKCSKDAVWYINMINTWLFTVAEWCYRNYQKILIVILILVVAWLVWRYLALLRLTKESY